MSDKVVGFCPMGCGETLFLGAGGFVTCSLDKCPNPSAAADVLAIRETEHVVELRSFGFDIEHPLRERLDGVMYECALHRFLDSLSGPPRQEGRYRVTGAEPYSWQLLKERS